MAKRPGGVMVQSTEATRSQLIPVITKWHELGKTAQLGPVLFCIVASSPWPLRHDHDTSTRRSWQRTGNWMDPRDWIYSSSFLIMLAIFLTMVSLYFIYRMIGKNKSWYILLGAPGFSAYYLWLFKVDHDFVWMYEFFHHPPGRRRAGRQCTVYSAVHPALPGHRVLRGNREGVADLRLGTAGPLYDPGGDGRKIGIEEPLDGILIGAASGGGFAVMETLIQYTPQDLVRYLDEHRPGLSRRYPKYRCRAGQMNFDQLRRRDYAGKRLAEHSPRDQVAHHSLHRFVLRAHGLCRLLRIFHRALGDQAGTALEDTADWPGFRLHFPMPYGIRVSSMDTVPLEAAIALLSYAVLGSRRAQGSRDLTQSPAFCNRA